MKPCTRRLAVEYCLGRWVHIDDLAAHLGKDRIGTASVISQANKLHKCFETIRGTERPGRPVISVKATYMPDSLANSVERKISVVQSEELGSVIELARERKAKGICAAPECFPIRRVA